jgi:hypothetical protein
LSEDTPRKRKKYGRTLSARNELLELHMIEAIDFIDKSNNERPYYRPYIFSVLHQSDLAPLPPINSSPHNEMYTNLPPKRKRGRPRMPRGDAVLISEGKQPALTTEAGKMSLLSSASGDSLSFSKPTAISTPLRRAPSPPPPLPPPRFVHNIAAGFPSGYHYSSSQSKSQFEDRLGPSRPGARQYGEIFPGPT